MKAISLLVPFLAATAMADIDEWGSHSDCDGTPV
jgi:hypothetical protein